MLRHEGWIIWLLGAAAFVSVPLLRGGIGLSWDALNHHLYLGWIAQEPRFHLDFWAARSQSYQFPYLYWPAYRLAVGGASGATAGAVLALLHSAAIPPIWMVARVLAPGATWLDLAYRALAVALGLLGAVSLALLDLTSNDLLAAIPFLWAVAIAFRDIEPAADRKGLMRRAAFSGVLAGASVAFKLSNGPLALVLPVLWAWGKPWNIALRYVLVAGTCTVLAFLAVYGPWGWVLWQQFGNPLYPINDSFIEGIRAITGCCQ